MATFNTDRLFIVLKFYFATLCFGITNVLPTEFLLYFRESEREREI